jgi:hypothetical protein
VNYRNAFIVVAPDCPVAAAEVPAPEHRGRPSVAAIHFEMIHEHPYRFTQEDVQFAAFVRRVGAGTPDDPEPVDDGERVALAAQRAAYLARPLACLRSSPLGKRYGWGLHFNADGAVAAYSVGSPEYERYASGDDGRVTVLTAMRSTRA